MSDTSAYKVRIETHTADSSAMILLADGALLGVLSELSDECHGPDQGKWTIEVAFGFLDQAIPSTFESASDAANWLGTRLTGTTFAFDEPVPELR